MISYWTVSAFECEVFFKWCQCPYIYSLFFIRSFCFIKVSFSHCSATFFFFILALHASELLCIFFTSSYFAIGWTIYNVEKTVTHTLLVLQNSIFAVRAFESFQDGNPFVMVRDSPFGWWWPYNTHRTTHLLFFGIRNIVSELVSVFHLVCYSHWEYINVFFNSFSFP